MIKKTQEEMVGFVLIIIIVSIILVVFLWFFLNNREQGNMSSYEAESFLNSLVQITTDCEHYSLGRLSIEDLIFSCNSGLECVDGTDSCEVLNSTIKNILSRSWKIGPNLPVKGYILNITLGDELIVLSEGNKSSSYLGAQNKYPKPRSEDAVITFTAFY